MSDLKVDYARPQAKWGLLGHGSDPAPGTPSAVAAEGSHHTSVAETIAGRSSGFVASPLGDSDATHLVTELFDAIMTTWRWQ